MQGIFNGVSNFLGFHLGKLILLQFRPLRCSRGHHLKVCFIRATKQGSKLYCKLHWFTAVHSENTLYYIYACSIQQDTCAAFCLPSLNILAIQMYHSRSFLLLSFLQLLGKNKKSLAWTRMYSLLNEWTLNSEEDMCKNQNYSQRN